MFSEFTPLIPLDRLCLEIPASTRPLPSFSTPGGRWRAYLNQRSLETLLPWLSEEQGLNARVWPCVPALPSFWEVVDATAIDCGNTRFVLVPTDAIDPTVWRIPQEWVDIPSWSADYYLALQVNPRAGWLAIQGYLTHRQLKAKNVYDADDRTYCLDEADLIQDLNVLWIAHQLGVSESLRAEIAPIPALPLIQAQSLLERLGDATIGFPRLAVPFHQWAGLLEHGGWRQQLYEQRQGLTNQWSIPQWLQTGIPSLAAQLGWGVAPLRWSSPGTRSQGRDGIVAVSRQFAIADHAYELRLLSRGNPEDHIWRFELRSLTTDGRIPRGFKLRLLTEDLQPFPNNEETATAPTAQLFIDVMLEPGEGLVWETDPMPDHYDREILRF
jgi:hypothetical protein